MEKNSKGNEINYMEIIVYKNSMINCVITITQNTSLINITKIIAFNSIGL